MDVLEAMKSRHSARRFEDRKIEQEKLERILEAGQLAPSASNRQEWLFIVVREQASRQELAKAANNQRFGEGDKRMSLASLFCIEWPSKN